MHWMYGVFMVSAVVLGVVLVGRICIKDDERCRC